jgi:dynein light chain roadblock-type
MSLISLFISSVFFSRKLTCASFLSSFLQYRVPYHARVPLRKNFFTMSEIEETFQRISQRPNVTGIIVVDNEGTPIRSTIEDTAVQNQYAHLITSLAAKARHCVRDLDPTNDLSFLRIRSKKNEIMVAPDKDFILIVIQNIAE